MPVRKGVPSPGEAEPNGVGSITQDDVSSHSSLHSGAFTLNHTERPNPWGVIRILILITIWKRGQFL